MLVHEVMSTGLVTANKTDTVRSAVIKMMNRHCGAIPVVEGNARLIGMVTLRDVLLPLYPNYGDYIHDNVHSRDFVEMEEGYPEALGGKVEEIMSRNPMTVAPHDPVLEAASYMGVKNFRRIPSSTRERLSGWSVSATSIVGYSSRKGCGGEPCVWLKHCRSGGLCRVGLRRLVQATGLRWIRGVALREDEA